MLAYSVTVSKSATFRLSINIASESDSPRLHVECDGVDKTGIIEIPNTAGYQKWEEISREIKLEAGRHLLKLVIDNDGLNLDKKIFKEIK